MTARTLSEIAALCGATLEGDGDQVVIGPASLADAGPDQVSFLANPRYEPELARTNAAGVIVGWGVVRARTDLALLRCDDPNASFTAVVRAFARDLEESHSGVHPSAVVAEDCELGQDVAIGPGCVVGGGARIGRGARLGARVVVGSRASVGADTVLHAGVVLYPGVTVGARCILHSGCIIGADGFGFDPSAEGWVKIPQCGTVEIEDEVEIGANATIDRGRFGPTLIGRGAKLDNLVHVAHNCVVGPDVLLCAQVGLSGSVRIGHGAILGGQAGVAGHTEVGPRARIAGGSGVFGALAGGADYLGYPARPRSEALKSLALPRRVERLLERLRRLEARMDALDDVPGGTGKDRSDEAPRE